MGATCALSCALLHLPPVQWRPQIDLRPPTSQPAPAAGRYDRPVGSNAHAMPLQHLRQPPVSSRAQLPGRPIQPSLEGEGALRDATSHNAGTQRLLRHDVCGLDHASRREQPRHAPAPYGAPHATIGSYSGPLDGCMFGTALPSPAPKVCRTDHPIAPPWRDRWRQAGLPKRHRGRGRAPPPPLWGRPPQRLSHPPSS
jgi:hypothetical protein